MHHRNVPLESDLQRKILNDLRSMPDCLCFKIRVSSDNGTCDIFFTTTRTGAVLLELKRPKEEPTKLQFNRIKEANRCGCKSFYCDSWESWWKLKIELGLVIV
jgi:hypothetical protein